jgi:hypothetical protein
MRVPVDWLRIELVIGSNPVKAIVVKVMPSSPPPCSAECERRKMRNPARNSVI